MIRKQFFLLILISSLLFYCCNSCSNHNGKVETDKVVSDKNPITSDSQQNQNNFGSVENSDEKNQVTINRNSIASDSELYKNYLAAINSLSTIEYFVVAKVKNLNTGEVREVCTQGNFLSGAIARENKFDYDSSGMIAIAQTGANNFKRYFEFKNKDALYNIGYDDYSIAALNKLAAEINFDSLANVIQMSKSWRMQLDDVTMKMYAHELFDRGILTGENSCWGGTLFYVDRNDIK